MNVLVFRFIASWEYEQKFIKINVFDSGKG